MTTMDSNCIDWFKGTDDAKRKTINNAMTLDFSVLCLNVRGDGNLGNMIRTACLYGCKNFYLAGRKKWDKRYSVGAHHYMDVEFVDGVYDVTIDTHHELECECGSCKKVDNEVLLRFIIQNNFTPCFVEQGGTCILEPTWKKTIENPLFIYGNETSGVPIETIRYIRNRLPSTQLLSIPQMGIMRSHNVATTMTIVLWEYARDKMMM